MFLQIFNIEGKVVSYHVDCQVVIGDTEDNQSEGIDRSISKMRPEQI